jgi:hypothetical protein
MAIHRHAILEAQAKAPWLCRQEGTGRPGLFRSCICAKQMGAYLLTGQLTCLLCWRLTFP